MFCTQKINIHTILKRQEFLNFFTPVPIGLHCDIKCPVRFAVAFTAEEFLKTNIAIQDIQETYI